MAANSKIEWTDHTFNPWIGCQKVSPGCDHCYAEDQMDKRFGLVSWGPHGERRRTAPANWAKPRQWARAAQEAGVRHRVFCASLADWLDNRAPETWRHDLAVLIDQTPQLDWLLLTKRIENFRRLSPWGSRPPDNVWLGATCEDQEHFDRRWAILRHINARVRFISYEPALGPIHDIVSDDPSRVPDWIIVGGESRPGNRLMQPAWAYAMRDLCATHGVAFFMKQMTGRKPIPADLLVRQFPAATRPAAPSPARPAVVPALPAAAAPPPARSPVRVVQ